MKWGIFMLSPPHMAQGRVWKRSESSCKGKDECYETTPQGHERAVHWLTHGNCAYLHSMEPVEFQNG